ncbi:MAG: MBL fold metallo-hydrolase [Micromonosporaceae bacterium]|nr:MBL fold metallo-hydrolase [Micromonosporaceae bacterium]
MKLTVVGCAGSFPGPEAPCSAYLLEAEGFRLLIDFGPGSLGALQRYTDMNSLDAVVLSHLHPDHILDACSYVVTRRYAPDAPLPRIPVYGPEGASERLAMAYDGGDRPLDDVYLFHTLRPGAVEVGPFRLTVDRVNHPVETYGMRLEHGGGTLAYSADTASCDALTKLATGADLFLCEASYLETCDNPPGLHLTGKDAGEHATMAEARKLLLTHLVQAWGNEAATVDEAASAYQGPMEVVRPGSVYEL